MKISTSILNSIDRINSVKELNNTTTDYIHIDTMDGIFVKNTTMNIEEIKKINEITRKKLDIHLMVENPINYIEKLNDMNIEFITFHLEINKDINNLIEKIKEQGYKVGVSIKPNTKIENILPYLKDIDLILVMSVEPGAGGQEFLPKTLEKISELSKIIKENNYDIEIEVDGGINDQTITMLDNVDIAVVGSYIINSDNYYRQIENLLKINKNKAVINSDNTKYSLKKMMIYKILLGIGILPFILIIGFGLFSMIFGFTFFFTTNYGIGAFFESIFFAGLIYWPILLIGLIFIIISKYKLVKLKKL